jgi:hypothetical protein
MRERERDIMDNQQATPTEAEIAWLAGIIEGEGSLTMAPQPTGKKGDDRYQKIAFHIVIYNTDGGIVLKAVEIIEGLGIFPHIMERKQKMLQMEGRPGYLTKDSLFTLKIMKIRDALVLLEAVRPWLFGDKGKRADIILKFIRRRIQVLSDAGHNGMQGGYRPSYDVEDWKIMKEFLDLGGRSTKMPLVERVLNEYERRASELLV